MPRGGTEDDINRIAFKFKQYGVFVHYGVGRGYTRINGVVVRGYNLYNRKKRTYRNEAIRTALVKKGYSDAEIKSRNTGLRSVLSPYSADRLISLTE